MNNIILIGAAGHQGSEYFKLLNKKQKIVALVDENLALLQEKYHNYDIPFFKNLDTMDPSIVYDTAVVCVPHYLHKEIALKLIEQNKTVIKEKPLAITSADINDYLLAMGKHNNHKLITIVQRSFNPSFIGARQELPYLGKIYNYQYIYNLSISNQTTGWRADWNKSYGGVLLDMGYHTLDVILTFFSKPLFSTAIMSYCYKEMQNRQLEDSISILIEHENDISGTVILNRHNSEKEKSFTILGSEGTLKITPQGYTRYDRCGQIRKSMKYSISLDEIKLAMFESYLSLAEDTVFLKRHFEHHSKIVKEIEHIYNRVRYIQYKLAA